jgi:hypothetical protein
MKLSQYDLKEHMFIVYTHVEKKKKKQKNLKEQF